MGVSRGFVYELGFYVVSFMVTGMLIRRFWPDSECLSLSEFRPYLVPIGWGVLIAVLFMLAGVLPALWKPCFGLGLRPWLHSFPVTQALDSKPTPDLTGGSHPMAAANASTLNAGLR